MTKPTQHAGALFGKETSTANGKDLTGLRVLIAEQHFTVRTWMREQLSVIGATSIAMAANATELIRMAKAMPYDIVICDHHLDDKRDGQQLLEELRYEHILPLRSVFIIATAERKYNHVVAAAEFAPDDYLVKPYTPDQLAIRLERSLRKKKALHAVFVALEDGAHEAAVAACDQVIKQTPRYLLDALRLKAESLVALGRVDEAAAIYESIASSRAIPWARMGYAMTLQRQNRLDQALDEAQRLNTDHPEFISVYDMLAQMHERAGEYDKAIECLERASVITSSSSTERLRRIADIAESAGNHDKAVNSLRRVVERTRKSSMLRVDDYLALTRSLLESERLDEATRVAEEMRSEAKHVKSGELGAEIASAMVLRRRGHVDEAKSSLDRVLDRFHRDPGEASDAVALDIAEEAAQHGDATQAASIIARISVKPSLPSRLKSRIGAWFGNSESSDTAGDAQPTRQAVFAEQIVDAMLNAIAALDVHWSAESAEQARQKLIDAFTLMPRDKRVINAHIRYNSIAVKHGAERHAPTMRS